MFMPPPFSLFLFTHTHTLSFFFFFLLEGWRKRSTVLIPLPSLIKKCVRSFVLSLSLSPSPSPPLSPPPLFPPPTLSLSLSALHVSEPQRFEIRKGTAHAALEKIKKTCTRILIFHLSDPRMAWTSGHLASTNEWQHAIRSKRSSSACGRLRRSSVGCRRWTSDRESWRTGASPWRRL